MENRRIAFLIGVLMSFFFYMQEIDGRSPGEDILNNEKLLRAHIENMPSSVTPFYNAEVKRRLGHMLNAKVAFTEAMLGRMIQYYPYIDSVLTAHNLPTDLKYITVIESSLKPEIHSHAGAAGLWQFMRPTGRIFGLSVNNSVDERLDPFLATDAAVKYLQHLYEIYEDWTLVLMAYNCGPGRLNRAIKLAGDSSYHKIAPYLPRETRDYIPKFIAANFFMKNFGMFGYTPEWPMLDKQLVSRVKVYDRISLREISDFCGLDLDILEQMNPSLRRKFIPHSKKGYYLTVPMRYSDLVKEYVNSYGDVKVDSKPLDIQILSPDNNVELDNMDIDETPDQANYFAFDYTVKTGDSWEELASLFNLNPFTMKYWSGNHRNKLLPGEKIRVYLPKTERNKTYISLLSQKMFGKLNQKKYLVMSYSNEGIVFPDVVVTDIERKINLSEIIQSLTRMERSEGNKIYYTEKEITLN